jgi:hypothetical protein
LARSKFSKLYKYKLGEEVLRTGKINQFDLSVTGGNDKTKFYASGSYSKQDGIIVKNSLNVFQAV